MPLESQLQLPSFDERLEALRKTIQSIIDSMASDNNSSSIEGFPHREDAPIDGHVYKDLLILKNKLEKFQDTYECPILKTIMNSPYTASSGQTYDLSAFRKYLNLKIDKKTDPKNPSFILNEKSSTPMVVNFFIKSKMHEKLKKFEEKIIKISELLKDKDHQVSSTKQDEGLRKRAVKC